MGTMTTSARKAPPSETTPLAYQLAKVSWIAPLLMFGINYFLRGASAGDTDPTYSAVIVTIIALFMYLIGLTCGIAALVGIPKHGWRGILVPAGIGILMNGVLLAVIAFISAGSILNKAPETVYFLDGRFSVTKPASWSLMSGELNDQAHLEIGNTIREAYCSVLSESRIDFEEHVTLEDFSRITVEMVVDALRNPSIEGPETLNLVNHQAIKYEIVGSVENIRIRYWHVSIESNSYYHQVILWSLPSRFERNRADFEDVLMSFRAADQ